jgi:predicted PurR-regulated permease PerM
VPQSDHTSTDILELSVEIALRLAVVALLVVGCFIVVRPFLILILWAAILAVALSGMFEKLVGIVGRRGWAATVMSLLGIAFVAGPSFVTGTSIVDSLRQLQSSMEAGTLQAPPPPESVKGLPFVGEPIYAAWTLASDDIQTAVEQFEPQIRAVGAWAVGFLTGVGGAIAQTLIALIIASAFLTYREGAVRNLKAVARRIAPVSGDGYVTMAGATVVSVAQGVLGVAAIQAVCTLILLSVFSIPAAGLLGLIMFVIATIQLPGLILMIFPIIWSFSNLSGIGLPVFVILAIVVGAMDTPLKAVLLGRGLSIPTSVILIGAIGGMVSMGMMGLFVGAVILGIGYQIMMLWLGVDTAPADLAETAEALPA